MIQLKNMALSITAQVVIVLALIASGGLATIVGINYVSLRKVSAEYYVATIDVTNHTPFTVTLIYAKADIFDSSGQRIAVADAKRPLDLGYVATFEQNVTVIVNVDITLLVPESQIYSYTPDEVFDVRVELRVSGGFLTATIPYPHKVTAAEIIEELTL